MIRRFRILRGATLGALAWGLTSLIAQEPPPTPLERTSSTSRQFVIYGGTRMARTRVARLADDLTASFSEFTGISSDWKWPVVVRLSAEPLRGSQRPRLSLLVGDGGTLRVQVDVPSGEEDNGPTLEAALLRALALEVVYREARPKPGRTFSMPPDWLVEAVWMESSARRDGLPVDLFERLMQSGPPPKLEAFLRQRPDLLDPISRAIYRAQALTFLRALLSVNGGRASLAAYLAGLHGVRAEDPQPLLEAFPGLDKKSADLAKLWTLEMARASGSRNFEVLTMAESNSRLDAILGDLRSSEPGRDPQLAGLRGPAAMPAVARERGGRFILTRKAADLLLLESQAHPLLHPIVVEYRTLATLLAKKARRDAPKRIAAAEELRTALVARGQAIADYMNWFEVTQMETRSGAFSENLGQTQAVMDSRRGDPIAGVLDALEASGPGR